MICARCQHDNRAGRRFCAECGAPLAVECPECRFHNQPDERFCGGCGTEFSAPAASASPAEESRRKAEPTGGLEAERREVTILFADLVGFTKLSAQLLPEETHRIMSRFFETVDGVISDHGGTVDKHMGDAVMALFGAPVAHGNDPERAAHAATEIHARLETLSLNSERDLKVHIGIASGQVVASGLGSASHREYTVLGESVNLAARLVDRARPGETLISDAVYRAVASLAEAENAGAVEAKGFEKAIKAWRLTGIKKTRSGRTASPLHGRRRELRQFDGALDHCRESGRGQAIYVRGEAGIGKSRLVEEFARLATEAGFRSHSALVLDFGVGKGRDSIRSLTHSLLDLPPGPARTLRLEAAERSLDAGLVDRAQRMFLWDLLNLSQQPQDRATFDAMENQSRNVAKQDVVVGLIKNLSARQPLLIAVEDLHWADALTLAHLARITEIAGHCATLIIMTSRVENDPLDHAWRQETGQAPFTTLDLSPLSTEESLALAQDFFGATSRLAASCVERAEGNPLFLEQLVRGAEVADEEKVPGSIRGIVLARIDRLEKGDKRALQAASVLGQRFSHQVVRHLIDDPSWQPDALLAHHLIRPIGVEYLFSHALIQESVYSGLLQDQVRALHHRAAQWFSDRDLSLWAEHLARTDSRDVAAAYLAAAEEQRELYRFVKARQFAEQGLAVVRDQGERFGLLMLHGECLRELGNPAASITAYEDALSAATTDVAKCRAWIGIAAGMRVTDAYDQALAILDKAESTATGDPRLVKELSQIHYYRGNIFFPLGNIDGCLEQHQQALEQARRAKSTECEAQALSGLGDACYSGGRMISALDHFQRCMKVCQDNDFGRIAVNNQYMVAWTRLYMGEAEQSLADANQAVDSAVRAQQARSEMVARLAAGRTLFELGRFKDAEEQLERGMAIAESLQANRFKPFFLIFLGRTQAAQEDDRTRPVERMREAVRMTRESGPNFLGPWALGSLALISPEAKERAAALAEGETLLKQGCVGHNYFAFYQDAMEIAVEDGDSDALDRYAGCLADYMQEEPLPLCQFYTERARALAECGRDPGDARARGKLQELRSDAEGRGLKRPLIAIEQALAV